MKQNIPILVVRNQKFTQIKRIVVVILSVNLMLALGACKKSDPVCNEWSFYVPNSFSPNGDGFGDVFTPKGTGVVSYQMKVFDTNGQLLYTTTNMNAGWDGTYNGKKCPEGTYEYLITATDQCGYQHSYEGSFTLAA